MDLMFKSVNHVVTREHSYILQFLYYVCNDISQWDHCMTRVRGIASCSTLVWLKSLKLEKSNVDTRMHILFISYLEMKVFHTICHNSDCVNS